MINDYLNDIKDLDIMEILIYFPIILLLLMLIIFRKVGYIKND